MTLQKPLADRLFVDKGARCRALNIADGDQERHGPYESFDKPTVRKDRRRLALPGKKPRRADIQITAERMTEQQAKEGGDRAA